MRPGKELRPSNSERVPYEQALAQAYAEGRLDDETYESRMQQVAEAVTVKDLDHCVRDVPFTWHEDRAAELARKRTRRTFLMAASTAALVAAGAGLGLLVPEVPEALPAPTPPPAPSPTSSPTPSTTPAPGAIATVMRQVPFGTADSFPTLASHLTELGVAEFQRVYTWGSYVSVDAIRDGQPVDVLFRTDYDAEIEEQEPFEGPSLPVSELAGIDAASLLARTGDEIELGDEPSINVRWFRQQWVIQVSGEDESIEWDITGSRKVEF